MTDRPLYGRPTVTELVVAVREFLDEEVARTAPRLARYNARVAANVLGIVSRELAAGEADQAATDQDLRRLGFPDEAALAGAIRDGRLDDDLAEVAGVVRFVVRRRVAVAHPGYDLGAAAPAGPGVRGEGRGQPRGLDAPR